LKIISETSILSHHPEIRFQYEINRSMYKRQKKSISFIFIVFTCINYFIYAYFSGTKLVPIFDQKVFQTPFKNATNNVVRTFNTALNAGIATTAATVALNSSKLISVVKKVSVESALNQKLVKTTLTGRKPGSMYNTASLSASALKATFKPQDSSQNKCLSLCPPVPPNLVGPLATYYTTAKEFSEIAKLNPGLKKDSSWKIQQSYADEHWLGGGIEAPRLSMCCFPRCGSHPRER